MSEHVFQSPLPPVNIPDVHITDYVLRPAATRPNHMAIVDGETGIGFTFAELEMRIRSLAGGLKARGFLPRDVLALIAPNCPDYPVVVHAVALCGGTVTTVNPGFGIAELRHQLLDSKATWVIADQSSLAVTRQAIRATHVTTLASLQARSHGLSVDDMLSDEASQVDTDLHTHPVVLPYSSGTTGLPKGVMLSHHNLVANLVQLTATLQFNEEEVALAVLPFFHIFGMQVLMGSLLSEGHTVVTMSRFDMAQALGHIEKYKVTQFFVVPPIVLGLANSPLVDQYELSSLRKILSGAAPLGEPLAADATQRIGCPVVQGYGMTELSPATHITPGRQNKPGTSGVAVPNTLSRIVDASGHDQPANTVGELLVKGPQVMIGYLNNLKASRDMVDEDGWLHTGDLAKIDEQGYMTVVDRVKELIKYKGFQVAPAELEAVIITHPDVVDVAVIGVLDDEAGEVPKAFLVFNGELDKARMRSKAHEVQQYVADRVSRYKRIQHVQWVKAIPKSASGKILRRVLRDQNAEEHA